MGTTIRAIVPATSDAASIAPRTTKVGALTSKGETVLLVEDEVMVREPARRMLARHGYRVLAAANADEAMRVIASGSGPIDLLLTDVVMPGLSGPQLADRLTARRPETRVVFMSGYPEAQDPALGFSLDGRSYLQKPFALAELAEKIRTALDE